MKTFLILFYDFYAYKRCSGTAVRLKREQIQLVVDGDVVGTGVAARKGLLQGHLLEKSD